MNCERFLIHLFMSGTLAACNMLSPTPVTSEAENKAYGLGPAGDYMVFNIDCSYEGTTGTAHLDELIWKNDETDIPVCPPVLSGFSLKRGKVKSAGKTDVMPPYQNYEVHEVFGSKIAKSTVISEDFPLTLPTNVIPDPCSRIQGNIPIYECHIKRGDPVMTDKSSDE